MPRAGLTTQRVTRAAAELADEVGLDNVTVSALARLFKVADASLYSHVKSVKDLRAKMAVLAAADLADCISAAVAGRAGKDALLAFAGAYRGFAHKHPGRYAATQLQLAPEQAAESVGHQRINETTYALFYAYGLSEPDLTDAVRLLRSAFHGYVSLEAASGFSHPRDLQTSWERGLEALHIVLVNWPSGTLATAELAETIKEK
jgi:AcrR family transcriptional regulator